uniref:SAM domain and HD domain 1 n=1 Tax=Gouania willdenowi TaxID=441366 RepID=A0A8C5EN92_GOUWI
TFILTQLMYFTNSVITIYINYYPSTEYLMKFSQGFILITIFNDPIHGTMELHPLLVKIIDTQQFQRLRFIKQLGGVYYVYPGASHNRFEHSISVCYLAGQLVKALKERQPELNISDRDVLCVQIAGLCHDLGHGPFSHVFDSLFIPRALPDITWKHISWSHAMKYVRCKLLCLNLHVLLHLFTTVVVNLLLLLQWYCLLFPDVVSNFSHILILTKFNLFSIRDCYHLGIQNNFDYHRFIKFARVCEVDGKKIICTRDKEASNLYNMFYTRTYLHQRACQHRVSDIIQNMIAEAFVKADEHIRIEGSGGKMFTLSTAIDDPEAYTKLTDQVFEQILNSTDPKLEEARKILRNIIERQLYKCLGQIQTGERTNLTQVCVCVCVCVFNIDYRIKDVHFYRKTDINKAIKLSKEEVSKLLPQQFEEQLFRVYCKKTDQETLEAAKKHFDRWCIDKKPQPPFPSHTWATTASY